MKVGLAIGVAIVALCASPRSAGAHEVRPAYLELAESAPGRVEVLWKTPRRGNAVLRLTPVLPAGCRPLTPPSKHLTPGALIERWTVACDAPLAGATIAVEGLERTITDVLVQIRPFEGAGHTIRLRPERPSCTIPRSPSAGDTARTYLALGVGHILGGVDHLLFVFALLLLVSNRWMLLETVTAFTIAHSLTLAAATLGLVHVPGPPVEAVIALSIVFLATELAHDRLGEPRLTQRHPWVVAFLFGLLHGCGFAGALAEIGLPAGQIPLALFLFNVGVEVGQLLFIAAMLLALVLARRFRVAWPGWARGVPAYGIGAIAAFWVVERVVSFW